MDTTIPDSQALQQGARLEEFVIERVLGSGGFGITYLALDTSLGRQVVIKENLPSQFAWRETTTGAVRPRHSTGGDVGDYEWSINNFLRESGTLASLDHPGIVRVLRQFSANGTAYFVMPFVDGVAFDRLIEDRKAKNSQFSEQELHGLIDRMLAALGYLHDRGIYHRDIKPANILITNDGIPVLIDFGSARQRLSERSMTVVESAGYTPFEQLQSRGNIGPWSDLYALGGTLERAITGQTPPKVMDRMRRDSRIPLAERPELRDNYSNSLLGSIDKAMEVEESVRWQNADEWLEELLGRAETRLQAPSFQAPDRHERIAYAPASRAVRVNALNRRTRHAGWIGTICLLAGLFALTKMLSNREGGNQTSKATPRLQAVGGRYVPDSLAPGLPTDAANATPKVGESNGVEQGRQTQDASTQSVIAERNPKAAPTTKPDKQSPPVMPQGTSFPKNSFFKMTHSNDVIYVGRRGGKSICTFEALQPMLDNLTLVLVMKTENDPYAGSPGDVIVRSPENGPELARLKGVRRTQTYRIPLPVKASAKVVISIETQHNDGMKLRSFVGNTPDLYLEPGRKY